MTPIDPFYRILAPSSPQPREDRNFDPLIRGLLSRLPAGPEALELRALLREADLNFQAEGLLGLAARYEGLRRLDLATEIYAAIATSPDLGNQPVSSALRSRAQSRGDAILGRGAIAPRVEFLLRNLTQQASDPSMIFAMGAAGAVFRMTRLAVLSRLAALGRPGFLTRLAGAGRLASFAGFLAEAPTFSLTSRFGDHALGGAPEWTIRSVARDVASSYLTIGGLRLAGWGGTAMQRALRSGQMGGLFRQGTLLAGILLGHSLEASLGLRPHRNASSLWVDSVAMLFQFHVAGRLAHQAFGGRFAVWERDLDRQSAALEGLSAFIRPEMPFRPLELSPALAMANEFGSGTPPISDRVFSTGAGSTRRGEAAPSENLPEIQASLDGRARPIDREWAPAIKVIEAQGVFWVIDTDTSARRRTMEVQVGAHLLPPGGSLRVRAGEVIRLGERHFRFREPRREFSRELPGDETLRGARVRRHLHPQYSAVADARYELRLGTLLEEMRAGIELVIASGPRSETHVKVQNHRRTDAGDIFLVEVRDAEDRFEVELELTPNRVILNTAPALRGGSALVPIFMDWLGTQTLLRASDLQIRGVTEALHELLGFGLIHSPYSRYERYGDRVDLVTQPRSTLLPMELGPQHREAATRAFDAWALRKFGQRIPSLMEIEDGAPLPAFNHLGLESNMPAILDHLIQANTRFLEIGFGERLETLEAVERRGGIAWGLEVERVYPPEADPETLRRSDLDVLFINGSPFLFYAQHHVALPAALDILRQFPRSEWLVIQAYNPRTPFEILRHAEELNRMRWEPMYYRAAASLEEAPIFPTDWCQRPDTPHAVLIARRPSGTKNGLTPRY